MTGQATRDTQTFSLNRRTALKSLAALGAGAAVTACAPSSEKAGAFTHGVASGDPTQSSVVIWTRAAAASAAPGQNPMESVTGTWQVAEDEAFTRILQSGAFATGPERDYTVKIDVTDLPPGRRLMYRFRMGDRISPVGRAITLPAMDAQKLRIALFSCSNYAFGYFNAYRHCAEREDIDLALHVGDYIYEYGASKYGDQGLEAGDRKLVPEHEIVTLEDYRARHALYRGDQDLQEIHRRLSFVTVWDDHEFTNDAWVGGAQNHQKGEGSWDVRRTAAMRAYFEWMPIRPLSPDQGGRIYRAFNYGDLATIIMLDTRIYGRDKQLDYDSDVPLIEAVEDSTDPSAPRHEQNAGVIKAVQRDGVAESRSYRRDWNRFRAVLNDPKRSILGLEQEAWLNDTFQRSYMQGAKWRILGQQTLLGFLTPPDPMPLLRTNELNEGQRQLADMLAELSRENMPLFPDSFGGSYRAARGRLLDAATASGGNTIVLTGDSHNAWAFNLRDADGNVAAVEIGATSVTSPGIETELPIDPADGEKALVAKNSELSYCKLDARGYSVVTVEPDAVTVEWVYVDNIKTRDFRAEVGKRLRIAHTTSGGTAPFSEA